MPRCSTSEATGSREEGNRTGRHLDPRLNPWRRWRSAVCSAAVPKGPEEGVGEVGGVTGAARGMTGAEPVGGPGRSPKGAGHVVTGDASSGSRRCRRRRAVGSRIRRAGRGPKDGRREPGYGVERVDVGGRHLAGERLDATGQALGPPGGIDGRGNGATGGAAAGLDGRRANRSRWRSWRWPRLRSPREGREQQGAANRRGCRVAIPAPAWPAG